MAGDDRVDHGTANVLLLTLPKTEGHFAWLMDEIGGAWCADGELVTLSGWRGDIVSLLPPTSIAEGMTMWGLKHDLSGIALQMG